MGEVPIGCVFVTSLNEVFFSSIIQVKTHVENY